MYNDIQLRAPPRLFLTSSCRNPRIVRAGTLFRRVPLSKWFQVENEFFAIQKSRLVSGSLQFSFFHVQFCSVWYFVSFLIGFAWFEWYCYELMTSFSWNLLNFLGFYIINYIKSMIWMRILNNDEGFLNILTNSNQNKNILRNISCLISWDPAQRSENILQCFKFIS